MLYVCVPTYNEAVTVGVLLWRLRTMLREQVGGRDYEIVVYDDASTDATSDVLAPYARVLPLTLLRGERRVGQSAAVDALVRHVVARSRSPETDAAVLIQADYTDVPELLPTMLGRFDAGADVVLTRRSLADDQPPGERRLRRAAQVLLPPFVRPAIRDVSARDPAALLSFLRLYRVAVLHDAVRGLGGGPLVSAPGWAGTAELVVRTAPFARRIEAVDAPARYDVRTRPSRIDWLRELRAVTALLWQNRTAGRHRRGNEHAVGTEASSVSGRMNGSHGDAAHVTGPLPVASPGGTSSGDLPGTGLRSIDIPATGADEVVGPADEAADVATDTSPSTPRRRRRGRGRHGTSPLTTDAVPDTRDASDYESRDETSDQTSHDMTDASIENVPGATAKRRRRRGGARRRSRSPERDTGVRPDDADSAHWQDAPSDQPPS